MRERVRLWVQGDRWANIYQTKFTSKDQGFGMLDLQAESDRQEWMK